MDLSYKFTMHVDLDETGNLIQLSEPGQVGKGWETNTGNKGITQMELTDSGNLNLLTETGTIVWSDSMMPNDLWTGPAENILKQGDTLNA